MALVFIWASVSRWQFEWTCWMFCAVQRTETRRTSTTGAVAREVAAETRTGKEGAETKTEKGEEAAEIVMQTARTADTNAGKNLKNSNPLYFQRPSLLISLSPLAVALHTVRRKRLKWKNIGMFLLLDLNTSHQCSTKPCRVRVCFFSFLFWPSLHLLLSYIFRDPSWCPLDNNEQPPALLSTNHWVKTRVLNISCCVLSQYEITVLAFFIIITRV